MKLKCLLIVGDSYLRTNEVCVERTGGHRQGGTNLTGVYEEELGHSISSRYSNSEKIINIVFVFIFIDLILS